VGVVGLHQKKASAADTWIMEEKREPLRWDDMDSGIRETVCILWENGVETEESCEGTRGHCYPEPTVCFHGDHAEGFRALAIAMQHGLRVDELRRHWQIIDGEPVGPHWQLTFHHPDGGGIHPAEKVDGKIEYEWGPVASPATGP